MVLDDGLPTATSRDQAELERRVLQIYAKDYADGGAGARSRGSRCPVPPTSRRCRRRRRSGAVLSAACGVVSWHSCSVAGFDPQDTGLVLNRKAHAKYLAGGLGELPSGGCTQQPAATRVCALPQAVLLAGNWGLDCTG